jgi:hypothetical protein
LVLYAILLSVFVYAAYNLFLTFRITFRIKEMNFADNAQCKVTIAKYNAECSSELVAMANFLSLNIQLLKEITDCRKENSCTPKQVKQFNKMACRKENSCTPKNLQKLVCPTLKKLGDCLKPAISCIKKTLPDQSIDSMTGLFNDCDTFISGSRTLTATETSDVGNATATEPSDKTTAAIKPKQTSDEGNATATEPSDKTTAAIKPKQTSDVGNATATEPSDKTTAAIKPEQTSIGHYLEEDFPDETDDTFVDSATSVQGSLFFLLASALL